MKVLVNADLIDVDGALLDRVRAAAGDFEVIVTTDADRIEQVIPDVEVVLGGIGPGLLPKAPNLRWVQSPAAGVDGALYPEFADSDVILTSAKGFVGVHLAEHAMGLLLAVTRGIGWAVRALDWEVKWPIRNSSIELWGLTMGIVGLGGTGRELAKRARAFEMRVIAVDPEAVDLPGEVEACWRMDRFHDLLEQSDVVAVCAPLTPETNGMFDRDAFQRMRRGAILVNVTRGGIMDGPALIEALEQGWIGGAGLDVTPEEPLPQDNPLWQMKNVVITPHTAGASPNRDRRAVEQFCENLRRYIAGERPLIGEIDKSKGY